MTERQTQEMIDVGMVNVVEKLLRVAIVNIIITINVVCNQDIASFTINMDISVSQTTNITPRILAR